ncbi:hypothetical protein A2159_02925 [Candidatus Woesebacteria bacterium RBG_13_34_9]|uniref:Methyltransferase FkbM domain-containing protein n=1 Tax=Candidatus Woesebacteria bacterium RBG_13_34_9 TaxID=1802477 RepID=A0A1F7X5S3_9BACT|nr:MAG: hypothetical protein A2159_02925 [Candidatus Woesebacteria bacterium RBG_13_34_9]
MIFKIYRYAINGLLGIFRNKYYSRSTKIKLLFDYFRFAILALTSFFIPPPKTLTISAFNLTITHNGYSSFFFLFNEIYCAGEYKVYKNIENCIILGAHIGLASLWYHLFNPQMKIYCFEPDKTNFRILQKNFRRNKLTNYTLFDKAVSNKTSIVDFYHIDHDIYCLDSGLNLNLDLPNRTTKVQTVKISPLIKKLKRVSLLKMDIEGEEYNVIEDLISTKTILNVEHLLFESHVFTPEDKKRLNSTLSNLKKYGRCIVYSKTTYSSKVLWNRS